MRNRRRQGQRCTLGKNHVDLVQRDHTGVPAKQAAQRQTLDTDRHRKRVWQVTGGTFNVEADRFDGAPECHADDKSPAKRQIDGAKRCEHWVQGRKRSRRHFIKRRRHIQALAITMERAVERNVRHPSFDIDQHRALSDQTVRRAIQT